MTRSAIAPRPAPPDVDADGLFATSPAYTQVTSQRLLGSGGIVRPTLATAVFDHVSLHGTWPGGAWRGSLIGGGASGVYPVQGGGYHQGNGRFTVGGSGDIAPAVAGAGNPGHTLEHSLVGAFAGLIALVVVAAMFITAEYRRGLIRTTLIACSLRGRVLVAKAVVIGAVAFLAGLAGIQTVLCSIRAPCMNAIAERWIGGCRRELLDRTLIWSQAHVRRIVRQYQTHHNQHRPHRSLHAALPLKPLPEPVDLDQHRVRRQARVGGLINEYRLVA